MNKPSIEGKWAIVFFIVILCWTAFEKAMGWHGRDVGNQEFYTVLFNIPMILIFFFSMQEKRNKYYNGFMSWWQGFISGMTLGLFLVALTPINHYIMYKYISPDFFSNAASFMIDNKKLAPEKANEYYSLSNFIIQTMTAIPWVAAATSALLATLLQRKRVVFED